MEPSAHLVAFPILFCHPCFWPSLLMYGVRSNAVLTADSFLLLVSSIVWMVSIIHYLHSTPYMHGTCIASSCTHTLTLPSHPPSSAIFLHSPLHFHLMSAAIRLLHDGLPRTRPTIISQHTAILRYLDSRPLPPFSLAAHPQTTIEFINRSFRFAPRSARGQKQSTTQVTPAPAPTTAVFQGSLTAFPMCLPCA